ncbi:hypothetical protein TNCV_727751 [Trichonephila clavipes]|nr:hypothetical protein TNCV_727751 [Trichonephila clavipes]
MNLGSVYSIKMVAFVFGVIVVNTYWQRTFAIVWRDVMGCYWIHVWSFLVCIDGTLNSARYISGVFLPLALPLFEPCETLRFSRIMPYRMLSVLNGPSLIRKMYFCHPGLSVH